MRKISILLLAIVMIASLFVSCDKAAEETAANNQDANIDAAVDNTTKTDYNFEGTWVSSYAIGLSELTADNITNVDAFQQEEESSSASNTTGSEEPTEAPSEGGSDATEPTEEAKPAVDISEFTDKVDSYINGGSLSIDFPFMNEYYEFNIPPAAPEISYTLKIDADNKYTISMDKAKYDKMVEAYAGAMVENAKALAAVEGKTYEQILKAAKFASHDAFVASIKNVLTYGLKNSADGVSYEKSGDWVFDGTYVTFDGEKFAFSATNENKFSLELEDYYLNFEKN